MATCPALLVNLSERCSPTAGDPSSWRPSWSMICARSSWPRSLPSFVPCPGQERDRFTALARSMGLPRVVRSMETLGRGIIDMRDAPDAQVVLEIAMVRVTRPEFDAGVEALAERVSVLERNLSAGTVTQRPPVAAQ
jgi:hypothetical protein